ncbi:hypothetical protein [Devosia sp. CN2-171]|uniref:hypothetical protein n=1 Tax=Devosia sp. CN2-171 TaxID=3400909 RepID=UPI003BF921DF
MLRPALLVAALALAAAGVGVVWAVAIRPVVPSLQNVVPAPASVRPASGVTFTITADTGIQSESADAGNALAALLRPATGFPLPVTTGSGIALLLCRRGRRALRRTRPPV